MSRVAASASVGEKLLFLLGIKATSGLIQSLTIGDSLNVLQFYRFVFYVDIARLLYDFLASVQL